MGVQKREWVVSLGCLVLALPWMAYGQIAGSVAAGRQAETRPLRDSLQRVVEEVDLLQHFLEASTVDPSLLYHSRIRAWVLNNPVLKDSLFNALLQADSSLEAEAGSDAEILGTLQGDIVQVRFGTAVFKGVTLRRALARSQDASLYRRLAESHRYSRDVELRDPTFRFATPLQPELMTTQGLLRRFNPITGDDAVHPATGSLDLSLDRLLVRIGDLAGVNPDSLAFAFECLSRGTGVDGARLEVERVPLEVVCETCGARTAVVDCVFRCGACGADTVRVASGRELEFVSIDVDEPVAEGADAPH